MGDRPFNDNFGGGGSGGGRDFNRGSGGGLGGGNRGYNNGAIRVHCFCFTARTKQHSGLIWCLVYIPCTDRGTNRGRYGNFGNEGGGGGGGEGNRNFGGGSGGPPNRDGGGSYNYSRYNRNEGGSDRPPADRPPPSIGRILNMRKLVV